MKHFEKLANGFHPLTISAKISILDIWLGSEYASPGGKQISQTNQGTKAKLFQQSSKVKERVLCTIKLFDLDKLLLMDHPFSLSRFIGNIGGNRFSWKFVEIYTKTLVI